MPAVARIELISPRCISAPAGLAVAVYSTWVEVALLLRASLPEWRLDEERWLHWVAPVVAERVDLAVAARFDGGRRSKR